MIGNYLSNFIWIWKCDQKITVILKFRELRCSIFAYFSVMLVHMPVIYVDNISHIGLSVCFWREKKLVGKVDQRNSIKFYVENKIKCMDIWNVVSSLLWAEPKFKCGIIGLRKAEKTSMTMLVVREGFAHFDCSGVVFSEFLLNGCPVNKECFLEVMHRLRETIRQKCTEKLVMDFASW